MRSCMPSSTGFNAFFSARRCAPRDLPGEERPGRGAEGPCRLHLVPHVPEQHAAHAPVLQVIDDPLAVGDLPVLDRLEAGVHLAHRLVAEVEEVRIESGQMAVGLARSPVRPTPVTASPARTPTPFSRKYTIRNRARAAG